VISVELLRLALLLLGSVLLVMLGLLLGHAVWLTQSNLRSRHLLEGGRRALSSLLDLDGADEEPLARLRSLPRRLQIRLLAEAALPLAGAHRDRLTEIYERLGVVDWAGRACSSRVWWKRLRAVRVLTLLRTGGTTYDRWWRTGTRSFARRRSNGAPCGPIPRSFTPSSITSATPRGSAGSPCRTRSCGSGPRSPIRCGPACWNRKDPGRGTDCGSPRGSRTRGSSKSALLHSASKHAATRTSAATLLGAVAGEAAVDRLVVLLADEDPGTRAAAAGALGEMGQWTTAHAVAKLLSDPAFPVRRAAGLALRSMGSPGEIFLRRYRTDADPGAAGIARQILDLPPRSPARASRR
jgi:hypothetical protein